MQSPAHMAIYAGQSDFLLSVCYPSTGMDNWHFTTCGMCCFCYGFLGVLANKKDREGLWNEICLSYMKLKNTRIQTWFKRWRLISIIDKLASFFGRTKQYFFLKKYWSVNIYLDKNFKKSWIYKAALLHKNIPTWSRVQFFHCLCSGIETPILLCPAARENKPTLSLVQENVASVCMH